MNFLLKPYTCSSVLCQLKKEYQKISSKEFLKYRTISKNRIGKSIQEIPRYGDLNVSFIESDVD